MTAKRRVVRFQEISLGQVEMAIEGKTSRQGSFKTRVEIVKWKHLSICGNIVNNSKRVKVTHRRYSYETRNEADLYLHIVNTTSGQRCIKFKGALLWNGLLDHIKNIRSINKFKSKLKLYLQQNCVLE